MYPRPARSLLLLASASLLLLSSCSKLDYRQRLPDETTEGKNTFGCKLDGEVWVAFARETLDREIEPEFSSTGFSVLAEKEDADGEDEIYLTIGDTSGLKELTYSHVHGFSASYINYENSTYDDTYTFAGTNGGDITFTKISPGPAGGYKAIVSGRFSFTATGVRTGKVITVTDGRFDVKVY